MDVYFKEEDEGRWAHSSLDIGMHVEAVPGERTARPKFLKQTWAAPSQKITCPIKTVKVTYFSESAQLF